jgi:hypothetical protein
LRFRSPVLGRWTTCRHGSPTRVTRSEAGRAATVRWRERDSADLPAAYDGAAGDADRRHIQVHPALRSLTLGPAQRGWVLVLAFRFDMPGTLNFLFPYPLRLCLTRLHFGRFNEVTEALGTIRGLAPGIPAITGPLAWWTRVLSKKLRGLTFNSKSGAFRFTSCRRANSTAAGPRYGSCPAR